MATLRMTLAPIALKRMMATVAASHAHLPTGAAEDLTILEVTVAVI